MDCDFSIVVLKGMIEQDDPAAYFGSTGALRHWMEAAGAKGWLEGIYPSLTVSETGHAYYAMARLDRLPQKGRGYTWDWSVLDDTEIEP